MFSLKYDRQPNRFLATLPKDVRIRLKKKIGLLKINPLPRGTIKIKGKDGNLFRMRIGSFRAVYEIHTDEQKIGVIILDKRSRAYKR